MSLNYPQVREQVKSMGMDASSRKNELIEKRERACNLLLESAEQMDALRQKVQSVVKKHDPSLRCALPTAEKINAAFPLPGLPRQITILAADGSQINLDRHAEVEYCLINVGAIQTRAGTGEAPLPTVSSQLFYAEELYNMTENRLALKRDSAERQMLADLAATSPAPVVSFTDGPMELWGAQERSGQEASDYQASLKEYLEVLSRLCELGVATAGYVDKPAANPVVRLLEVADTPEEDLPKFRESHPLRGVTDFYLYQDLLAPGERSAVYALQSQSAASYTGSLGLHFFYLNVGRTGKPWLARVEVPGWVMESSELLDNLHAVLVDQCRSLGTHPYPYLLHRAHETALVSLEERDQVTQMIALEYRRLGVQFQGQSYKQANKDLAGRTRYTA